MKSHLQFFFKLWLHCNCTTNDACKKRYNRLEKCAHVKFMCQDISLHVQLIALLFHIIIIVTKITN